MPTKSPSKTITRDPNWLGPAIPPGEILLEEYLKLGIPQIEAARRLDISLNRLNEILLGKRGITADAALRLAQDHQHSRLGGSAAHRGRVREGRLLDRRKVVGARARRCQTR
jgi:addiction module HigA family antidote